MGIELSKLPVYFYLLCLCLSLASCETYEEPSVVSFESVQIISANISGVHIAGDLVIHNPNQVSLDLERTEIRIFLDEQEIAEINQVTEATMPATKDFKLPIEVEMKFSKLLNGDLVKALQLGNEVLSRRELDLVFKGHLYAGKDAIKMKIPINRTESIAF